MNNSELVNLLKNLKEIYHQEGCYRFDGGINSIIEALSDSPCQSGAAWERASSIYRTMAGTKSGFSDVYIDASTADERVAANILLDDIRQKLLDTFEREFLNIKGTDMKSASEAMALMTRISELLRLGGRIEWAECIEQYWSQLLLDTDQALSNIMMLYGGMGSINDIVLYRDGLPMIEENNELHVLLSKLYDCCVATRR